jgi:hypothetical protein
LKGVGRLFLKTVNLQHDIFTETQESQGLEDRRFYDLGKARDKNRSMYRPAGRQ